MNLKTSTDTPATVIDALDLAIACHENIFILASLLEDSGTNAADNHENSVRSGAGRLIAIEARKMGDSLTVLEEHYPRPTKRSRSDAKITHHKT